MGTKTFASLESLLARARPSIPPTMFSELQGEVLALKKQAARAKAILQHTAVHLLTVNDQDAITSLNRFDPGIPEDYLLGPIYARAPVEDHEAIKQALETTRREGESKYETRGTFPDGSTHWFECITKLVQDEGKSFVLVTTNDVTERKQAEMGRDLAESKYATFFALNPVPLFATENEGTIIDANEAACKLSGYSRDELIGSNITALYADQRTGATFRQKLEEDGRAMNFPLLLRRKDGKELNVEASVAVTRDDGSKSIDCLGVLVDTTFRVNLEEQLRQAQKMEAIGRLAGGVAHDFNNLLTVITGSAELVRTELGLDHAASSDIQEIEKAAKRAAKLTTQLLSFSRQQVIQPQVLDINATITDTTNMLQRLIGEDIVLETTLEKDLTPTYADPGQLQQIIMNLALNARDAMPKGGKLTIRTYGVKLDQSFVVENIGSVAGDYTALEIQDNGTGMNDEVKSHIFEPFFTTKELGKGTGLGLSMVYGITKQHQGYVTVDSAVGKGTTFTVYLPQTDEPTEIERTEVPHVMHGQETILIVEDEEAVMNLAQRILQNKGFNVLVANTPNAAIAACNEYVGNIGLILTDIIMPEMRGNLLAAELLRRRPGMKILYMSGYSNDLLGERFVLDAGINFLQKPFMSDALCQKVREVLDSASSV